MNPGDYHTHPLFSYADCRENDRLSIERGFSETQLMGQAALASLYQLQMDGHLDRPGKLIFLCGSGNNGGDGLALAYMLLGKSPEYHSRIRIFRTGEAKSEAARLYTRQLENLAVEILPAEDFLREEPGPDDIIIEALLGIGQVAPPREPARSILRRVLELRGAPSRPALIALDVPAGLREDQRVSFLAPGNKYYPDLREHATIFPAPDEMHTYGVDKIALRLNPDLAAASRIHVLPIGFYPEQAGYLQPAALMPNVFAPADYRKAPIAHKYTAGHALLVGGSAGMEGAALLASRAFFAAGGGILKTLVPRADSRAFLTAAEPTVMFLDLESSDPTERLADLRAPVIALGPGLAPEDLDRFAPALLAWLNRLAKDDGETPHVILDAGALPLIASGDYPDLLRAQTICTPHSGEWRRLVAGFDSDQAQAAVPHCVNGMRLARDVHKAYFMKTWMLIKDAVSVLLCPEIDGRLSDMDLFSRPLGNLAVAGSGDVLTGILAAVLARRNSLPITVPEAVRRAMELHYRAASLSVNPEAARFPELIRAALTEK